MNGPLALVALRRGQPTGDLRARPDVLMLRYWQEVFTTAVAAAPARDPLLDSLPRERVLVG